jgi:hypothetical protein
VNCIAAQGGSLASSQAKGVRDRILLVEQGRAAGRHFSAKRPCEYGAALKLRGQVTRTCGPRMGSWRPPSGTNDDRVLIY